MNVCAIQAQYCCDGCESVMRVARDVQMIFKSSSTSKSSNNNNSRVHYSRELSHSGLYGCKKLLTQYNCVCSMQAIENEKENELKIANFFLFLSVSVSVSCSLARTFYLFAGVYLLPMLFSTAKK